MASFASAGRLTARLVCGQRLTRSFMTSSRLAVAQNFTMPALSPTMTEGNISQWQVKEGDKFATGDVLLEIETDKATMDVEAQDDGIVFKIVKPNGAKGIPVGARIAVLAEADDDLASLEMPPDEPVKAAAAAAPEAAAAPAPTSAAPSAASAAAPASTPTPAASSTSTPSSTSATPRPPQKYPLYPSVAQLLHERGLDAATTVPKITPTGPNGRILKGDVLAFLGLVAADAPVKAQALYDTLGHLDLSNIKIKEQQPKKDDKIATKDEKAAAQKKDIPAVPTIVSLPVSLAAVLDVQDKLQSTLGVYLPVSTFVARATDVANDALPRAGPVPAAATAAELFDEILATKPKPASSLSSSSAAHRTSPGHYLPQISALPPGLLARKAAPKPVDIIDLLAGKATSSPAARKAKVAQPPPAVSTGLNYFSLQVPAAEEKRAEVFLERLKDVLEKEPGRLVL